MQVHVIGPNLPDQSKGDFHVHAKGCADVRRSPDYRSPEFSDDKRSTIEAASLLDLAEYAYADQIGEGSMTAEQGAHDFHVFPCAREIDHL